MLTAVLRGFHQAPHDLPTVQTTATLIVHCAATFLQSASRILRSLTLYSILKVSYHLWCQVKPAPRTRTLNTFHCGSNLQILSKNKFVYVTDMRSLTKLIPNTLSLPPPPLSSTATLVRALGRPGFAVSITCAVKPIALLALCDFGRVCKFGALHCRSCPETDILQGLSLPPHPSMRLTNENICHFLTSWCKR